MSFPHAKLADSLSLATGYIDPTPLAWVSKLQPPSGVPPL
ncbi:hypothetical protein KIN_44580 [Litoreibacter roseus]|uniref:Uncharacterized protein n=1 Tax=Litoreibacter roseus TaxID=2601869 RepID=A0A6N6JMJ1_9RHOB|nr:hypothetical protein KIN_44580 [Litoreibacter roseus]